MAINDWGYQAQLANYVDANITAQTNNFNSFSTLGQAGLWSVRTQAWDSQKTTPSIAKSKTVAAMIKEEFKNISSKPIVKEIMAGLIRLKKEQVSQVVNEMLAI